MSDDPYDWQRARDFWGRGDGPISHYEFYDAIQRIETKLDLLHDRMEVFETRLPENLIKHFLIELVTTWTGRMFVLIVGFFAFFILHFLGFS